MSDITGFRFWSWVAPTFAHMSRYHDDDLLEAAASIADMAGRVQSNGGERHYTTEKLSHALFKAAEGLALAGLVDVDDVCEQARKGFERGRWLRG
jgi:hypothetical protein